MTSIKLLNKFLLGTFVALIFGQAYGQSPVSWNHSDLSASATKSVLIPNPCLQQRPISVKLWMELDMGEDYDLGANGHDVEVEMKIRSQNGATTVGTWTPVLKSTSDAPESRFEVDVTNSFSSLSSFMAEVVAYTNNGPTFYQPHIRVRMGYEAELGTKVVYPTSLSNLSVSNNTGGVVSIPTGNSTQLVFSWSTPCTDIPNYQVQILRLFNEAPNPTSQQQIVTNDVVWERALTLETDGPQTSMKVTLSEGEGYYAWRVRAIGSWYDYGIADYRNYGAWTGAGVSNLNLNSAASVPSGVFYYEQFDQDKNWIHSRMFTEGGRVKEQMTYANGLQQSEQSQVYLPSTKNTLVSQSVYDLSGRAAMQSMPAPANQAYLKYKPGVLQNGVGAKYSADDFDKDVNYHSPTPATGLIANYYNGLSSEEIPDAQGYVYSRSLYYGDGTSRVREQSGVGKTHMINNGLEKHTTRVFYSAVDDQELVRIFGDEAPSARSVQKVITVDPNGTGSVSYVDKAGQTIATCLSSSDTASTDLLEGLPSRADGNMMIEAIVDNNVVDGNLIKAQWPLGLSEETQVTLSLELTPNQVEDLCTNICQWCDYNIYFNIRRTDDPDPNACNSCGEIRPAALQGIGGFDCATALNLAPYTTTVTLAPGSYVIERIVETRNPSSNNAPYTFEQTFVQAVRTALEAQADVVLQPLYTFLNNDDLDGFNNYLGTSNLINGDHWELQIGSCCAIEVPYQECPDIDCGNVDWEQMLVDRWAGTSYEPVPNATFYDYIPISSPYHNPNTYDFDTPGNWAAVVGRMLLGEFMPNDPDSLYSCEQLYACWRGVVEGYGPAVDALAGAPVQYGGPQDFDPVEAFLSCAGHHIKWFQDPNGLNTEWQTHPYAYFPYQPGDHPNCENLFVQQQGGTTAPLDWVTFTSEDWHLFYTCVNSVGAGASTNPSAVSGTVNDIIDGCQGSCESRFEGYLQMVVNELNAMGEQVEGEWDPVNGVSYNQNTATVQLSEVYCYAQGMVDKCKMLCGSISATQIDTNNDNVPDEWDVSYSEDLECWLSGRLSFYVDTEDLGCSGNEQTVFGSANWQDILPHFLNQELAGLQQVANLNGTTWNVQQPIDDFLNGPRPYFMNQVSVVPAEHAEFVVDGNCQLLFRRTGALVNTGTFYEADGDYTEVVLEVNTSGMSNGTQYTLSFPGTWTLGNPSGTSGDGMVIVLSQTQFQFTPNNAGTPATITFSGSTQSQLITTNVCGQVGCLGICVSCNPLVVPAPFVFEEITCEDAQTDVLETAISQAVDACFVGHMAQIEDEYQNECIDNYKDEFKVSYDLNYHHYTLYFNDRAGNLVRTVPPHGVDLSSATRQMHPEHRFETRYEYNSLGQLVWRRTPDGGISEFWYDDIGRLRFSQNAEQKPRDAYSYLRYDYLGRVTEVGESEEDAANLKLHVNVNGFPTQSDQETYTVYTRQANVTNLNGQPQTFLENNVSYVYTHEGVYTFFSYDPHGNVDWMIQRIPGLGDKEIAYEYDLISGNVFKVSYQSGQVDEFYHRYTYDEDNRLILAETSEDGIIWEKDGRYEYYTHGPLSKLTTGEDKVQGCEHVYTLQGWLKALNHPSLDPVNDPSQDGINGSNVGRDTWGMVLGYFDGDFRKDGSKFNSDAAFALNPSNLSPTTHSSPYIGLYNGNISSWAWRWDDFRPSGIANVAAQVKYRQTRGYVYRYDELNRIASGTHHDLGPGGRPGPSGDFAVNYDYDAGGNIMHLDRDAYDQGNGKEMDRLEYWYYRADMTNVYCYEPSTHQYFYGGGWSAMPPLDATNKLAFVKDSEGETHDMDLDNQSAGNYTYNEIGELTEDAAEGLTTDWTLYHKVDAVSFANNPSLAGIDFGYGPMQQRVRKILIPNSGPGVTTFYVRDAQGNVMSVYRAELDGNYWVTTQTELPIYGSDRLGQQLADRQVKKTFNYNPQGNSGDSPLRGMLVISEVNYDSPSGNGFGEYVSLKNVGEEEIDIEGVSLGSGKVSYVLPTGQVLAPGEYVLVANGPALEAEYFLAANGLDATLWDETEVIWQTVLGLSDKGGSLRLFDQEGLSVDELVFGAEGVKAVNPPESGSASVAQRIDTSVPTKGSFDVGLWGVREATGTGAKLKKSLVAVRGLGSKVYEMKDHLGNVRVVVSNRKLSTMVGTDPTGFLADVRELKDYYTFGILQPGQAAWPGGVADGYRYGFNGMERDDELKGQGASYDFGARMLDVRVGRWGIRDPLEGKYPEMSSYGFVGNMPIVAVDPDGKDIYILFYTVGNDHGDEMFKAAALTRKRNIEKGQFFSPENDKVVMIDLKDISDIDEEVGDVIQKFSGTFGKTTEVGIWSHGAWDGPIGTVQTQNNSLKPGSGQMAIEGWGGIEFNWVENEDANITFYGCNTGNEIAPGGYFYYGAFARKVSELENFSGVQVGGQSSSSFPSFSPIVRSTNIARSSYPSIGFSVGDTYMVGGNEGEGINAMWFTWGEYPISNQLNIFSNGQEIGSNFQSEYGKKPIYPLK